MTRARVGFEILCLLLVLMAALLTLLTLPLFHPVHPPPGTHPPLLTNCRCGADLTPADWEADDQYKRAHRLDQYAPKGGEHVAATEGDRPSGLRKGRTGVRPLAMVGRAQGGDRPEAEASLQHVPAPAAKGGVSDAADTAKDHRPHLPRRPMVGFAGVRPRQGVAATAVTGESGQSSQADFAAMQGVQAVPGMRTAIAATAVLSATPSIAIETEGVIFTDLGNGKGRISCPPCAVCSDPPPCSNPVACPSFTDPIDAHLAIASVDYHAIEAGVRPRPGLAAVRYILLADQDAPMTIRMERRDPHAGDPVPPAGFDDFVTVVVDREPYPALGIVCVFWDGVGDREPDKSTCAEYGPAIANVPAALTARVPRIGNGKPYRVVGGPVPTFRVVWFTARFGAVLGERVVVYDGAPSYDVLTEGVMEVK